jgi:TPR repeat protein
LGRWTIRLLATLLVARAVAQTHEAAITDPMLEPAAIEARGFDYWLGRGVERDFVEAASWLEQAAAAGRPYAAAVLADLYRHGRGVERDLERARELNRRAASAAIAPAQTFLGFEFLAPLDKSESRDPAAALPWVQAAAEQEDATALYYLAQMHVSGEVGAADWDLAQRLLTRAAELGYPPAGAQAGVYLLGRDAAPEDVQRGLYFLRTAAASGNGLAAYALGMSYLFGQHVERDAGLAAQWLTRASELEVAVATAWLAELYMKGLGVTADVARAQELRRQVFPTMSVTERNRFAWRLAVGPDADLRNGGHAVEIMEIVAVERPIPAYLDTLAAAYAEAGRFDDAMRAQQRAIDALPSDAAAAMRESFADRAALYRTGQPYREAQ